MFGVILRLPAAAGGHARALVLVVDAEGLAGQGRFLTLAEALTLIHFARFLYFPRLAALGRLPLLPRPRPRLFSCLD